MKSNKKEQSLANKNKHKPSDELNAHPKAAPKKQKFALSNIKSQI